MKRAAYWLALLQEGGDVSSRRTRSMAHVAGEVAVVGVVAILGYALICGVLFIR